MKINSILTKVKKWSRIMGPGLITGVADDDPSGIATCCQTGAKFGFNQLWTPIFMLPMMISVQEAVARIGTVKGRGLGYIINKYYSKKLAAFSLMLLLIANTINIGADLGSMAAAMQLILPFNFTMWIALFIIFIMTMQIFIKYNNYVRFLKWLCLSILAYPIVIFIIGVPIDKLLYATFVPHIEFNYNFLFLITGIFGTTISPYMFFWQASQEVEEDHARHLIDKDHLVHVKKEDISRIRFDNVIGMAISQITTWSIIVVAAQALHVNGIFNINTAEQAAKMLEPLVHSFPHAGYLAKVIFSLGIVGLGLIAVPILAGSTSYGICEILNVKSGFNLTFRKGKIFYYIMIFSMVIGALINYIGIDPFKLLVIAAVINGVLAIPLIFIIALIVNNKKIMQKYKSGWLSNSFITITFFSMLASAVGMFLSFWR